MSVISESRTARMSRLSLRCEVPSCGFRTPELPSLHYPAMVEQLKLHTSQLHGTVATSQLHNTVATSQLHTNQLNSPEAAASKAQSPSAYSRPSPLIKPTTTT